MGNYGSHRGVYRVAAARLGAPLVDAGGLTATRTTLDRRRELATRRHVDEYLALRWDFHAACAARDGEAAERIIRQAMRWAMDRNAQTLPLE